MNTGCRMLRTGLLLIALSGLQAKPLPNDLLQFQNGGWVIGAPKLVQDQLMDNFVYSESNEQSRHSPTDLNNDLIKKHSSVINYESKEKAVAAAPAVEVKVQDNPIQKAVGAAERRQGTEPSRRFLVDLNTGLLKEHVSEMDRRVSGFYNYPSNREFRQGTEPSRRFLVDLRTGHLKSHVSEMNRRVSGSEETVAGETVGIQKARPVEMRRQGTEPSRRFLVDLNTGILKEHISEMDRRVSGFYSAPSHQEFRQGTENSRRTLVDIRTGLQLAHLTEMQRRTSPLDEFRQGTEYSPAALVQLRRAELMENMERDIFSEDQSKGKDSAHHRASPPEIRRQGTEPSRRFLTDPNTGMLKEHVSEMDRRVSGFYNYPSNYEFRQGTENSQATLVDIRSGHLLAPLSEMQRTVALLSDQRSVEHSPDISPELQSNHLIENIGANEVHIPDFRQAENMEPQKALEHNEVMEELMHSMEYSHANIIDNRIMEAAEIKKIEGDGVTMCQGEEIDGKCYYFNSNLLTFSEAETSCKRFSSLGHLASVTSSGLHIRLVELVTRAKGEGVLTWLGGIMRDQQFEWTDGSSWEYSDWMPGHPSTEKYDQSCMEMFRMGESWWTAADCDLKRASVCSYPVTAL